MKILSMQLKFSTRITRRFFLESLMDTADLMITDKIEVFLQTKQNPALCETIEEPLNYQEKGFMISKDRAFQTVLNDWLNSLIASGEMIEKFEFHLGID